MEIYQNYQHLEFFDNRDSDAIDGLSIERLLRREEVVEWNIYVLRDWAISLTAKGIWVTTIEKLSKMLAF